MGTKAHPYLGQDETRGEQTHREIVCTGGVFADTKRLVRLYPLPMRFMTDKFGKYQWITADVRQAPKDPRPESYKIQYDAIELGETIPTKNGDWNARAAWIINPTNCFASVEALQLAQQESKTSLGIVKPSKIIRIHRERFSASERAEYWERHRIALAQMELPLEPEDGASVKPLAPPDFRFKIGFHCDEATCSGHDFSVLDWEVDALYSRFKDRGPENAAKQVESKLAEICRDEKDTRFFLGNISSHPQTFTIVGLWYPRKKEPERQGQLF